MDQKIRKRVRCFVIVPKNTGMNLRKFIFNSKILGPYIKNFERKDGENVNVDTSYAHEVLSSGKEGNFKVLRIP